MAMRCALRVQAAVTGVRKTKGRGTQKSTERLIGGEGKLEKVGIPANFSYFGPNRPRDPWQGDCEWLDGTLPGDYGMDVFALSKTPEALAKNRVREIMHGRFAMLAVAGAFTQEELGQGAWFATGRDVCEPGPDGDWLLAKCTVNYPASFGDFTISEDLWQIAIVSTLLMIIPEVYRTALWGNRKGVHSLSMSQVVRRVWPDCPEDALDGKSAYAGGTFNPLKLGVADPDTMGSLKTAEIKHCRLAMVAWLGFIAQAFATNPEGMAGDVKGPVQNLIDAYNSDNLFLNSWPGIFAFGALIVATANVNYSSTQSGQAFGAGEADRGYLTPLAEGVGTSAGNTSRKAQTGRKTKGAVGPKVLAAAAPAAAEAAPAEAAAEDAEAAAEDPVQEAEEWIENWKAKTA